MKTLYSNILHQLYIKSLVIIIAQSQLLLVSIVFDNCQLFYVVISTYIQLVFDKFESDFYNMKFRLYSPFLTIYTTTD
jgi:hypothetical protein